jgi:protein NrfD
MNEIDLLKATTYLTERHWWDWQIPLYLFLGGVAAGLMVLTSLRVLREPDRARSATFRLLAWLAPVALSVGMLALWLDLEKRWHVPRFYMAFRPKAPMSWGAWILLAVYPFVLLFALGELPDRIRTRFGDRLRALSEWADRARVKNRLAWGNAIVGASLGIYTGVLLSTMSARPLWASSVLGPLFLVSGTSTAAAVMLLFRIDAGERRVLSRLDLGLIVLELVLLSVFLLGLMTGGAVEQSAGRLLLGGPYAASFFSLVIFAGLLIPLLGEAWEVAGNRGSRWFVPALILIGGLALRWILVSAGQTSGWHAL